LNIPVLDTKSIYQDIYYKVIDMAGKYSEKTCPCCGKIGRRRSDFCSQTCVAKVKRDVKVQEWLKGNHNGMRGKTSTAYWIKQYMIEIHGEKCMMCDWSKRNPHTGKVPIELSHKDGNFTNNKIENLELICPNCHSLTDSYKGANKKEGRPRSKYYRGL
jgi:endogenous inhibitor of DNA gyrase (YacG/DUF329 family)